MIRGKLELKKIILGVFIVIFLASCSSEGAFIDVRERSDYFKYGEEETSELADDHLPEVKITKNETGATKGTPAKIGDTVIYKVDSGQDIGVKLVDIRTGDKASEHAGKVAKDNGDFPNPVEFLDNPSDSTPFVATLKMYSYDSMDEPYHSMPVGFVLEDSEGVELDGGFVLEAMFDDPSYKSLKTGEEAEYNVILFTPEDFTPVYIGDKYEDIWFEIE